MDAANAIKILLEKGPRELNSKLEEWTTEQFKGKNILFYQGRNYVPNDLELRKHIVHKYHNTITAGHPGELETFNAVRRHYWWPGMRIFVKNYVKGCGKCQQFKINRNPANPAFLPIQGAKSNRPFAYCSMDMITDLPMIDGYDSILSVVDHGLTKGVIFIPCSKTVTEEEVGKLLLKNVYRRFGLPDSFLSDRGPQFAAKAFRELLKLLGIESKLTTAYHPQGDGTTERFNQEIEAYLAIFCSSNPETWKDALPTLEFTHNDRKHADRRHSPFELMMGTQPLAIPISFENTKFPSVEERLKNLLKDREEAIAAHELARARMITRKKGKTINFKIGQKVWLDSRNLKTYNNKKLSPRREGPFKILEQKGPVTFKIELPITWRIHDVFHASLLMPYTENNTYGSNFPEPPPELINEEEHYKIEAIISHRKQGKPRKGQSQKYKYLVKWAGYSVSSNLWEPSEMFGTTGKIVLNNYQKKHGLPLTR